MTVLGSLAQALARLDARRSRVSGNQIVSALPQADSIVLADGRYQRLVSYSDVVAESPIVFSVWSRLVQTLSTTDIVVERRQDDGSWQREKDTTLEKLLREPAPGFGLIDTLQWFYNPYFVEGNGLVVKYRENARATPSALLPLDWRHVSAWATYGGPVDLWSTTQTGEEKAINPSEVVHLAWSAPTAGPIGVSPLGALSTAVKVADAANRALEAQYRQGLRLSGFLVYPSDTRPEDLPDDEGMEAMKSAFMNAYGGVDNQFKVAVLKGGMDFKTFSMSVADSQVLDARAMVADDVYRAFGVRRSDFEDAGGGVQFEDRSRSLHRSLIPHTRLLEHVLQRQLIDPEPAWRDLRVRFDSSDLLRGTYREELEAAVHGFTNGLLSVSEARESLGLATPDSVADADALRVPHAQLAPADNRAAAPSDRTTPDRQALPTPDVPTS